MLLSQNLSNKWVGLLLTQFFKFFVVMKLDITYGNEFWSYSTWVKYFGQVCTGFTNNIWMPLIGLPHSLYLNIEFCCKKKKKKCLGWTVTIKGNERQGILHQGVLWGEKTVHFLFSWPCHLVDWGHAVFKEHQL